MSSKTSSRKTADSAASKPASLRQKVLTKATTSAPKVTPPPPHTEQATAPRELPNTAEISIINDTDLCASDSDMTMSPVESTASSTARRVSLLYTTPKRGTGVEMDLVTGVANTLLQSGKSALESALNMKREAKITATESLQGLYETVLSLSDSRNRHKCNLEKERSRHAQELVHVERAHSKALEEANQKLFVEMGSARREIAETLKEAQAVRSWLGYETAQPFREIKEIKEAHSSLSRMIKELAETKSEKGAEAYPEAKWKALETATGRIEGQLTSLANRLDVIRRDMDNLVSRVAEIPKDLPETAAPEEENGKTKADTTNMIESLVEIKQTLAEIKDRVHTPIPQPLPPQPKDITPDIREIAEKIEIMSSEVRTIRDTAHREKSPPRPSLDTELAVQEVKDTLATIKKGVKDLAKSEKPPPTAGPNTFAQAAAKPRNPHPNHTLIIASKLPTETSENVITKLRDALDLRKTGAKVDRVRKARDQKVVLRCPTKEDMNTIKTEIKKNKDLTIKEPTNQDPLVCVRGVLSCLTNEELVEYLKAQNKHLLQDVNEAEMRIRVRYKKRARNPHECHPVFQLSPTIYKRFVEAGKVYIGFGRCTVEDQSPLVQCAKCLGFGHTRTLCRATKELCSYCGEEHAGKTCQKRQNQETPRCANCVRSKREASDQAHTAYSQECQERLKWDGIARSRVQYC